MSGKECEIMGEGIEVEKIVTTANIVLFAAAEKVRERTIIRRARIEGNEIIIGVGFAHISNAAYWRRDPGAIPPPTQSGKHTSGLQALFVQAPRYI